ncbi:hypothetical protein H0H87_010251 [Tephrocybe sp. NHM501043]|nr:hypothetical protein H0H87_010251 [Tephrocybe sp. NHM501043]
MSRPMSLNGCSPVIISKQTIAKPHTSELGDRPLFVCRNSSGADHRGLMFGEEDIPSPHWEIHHRTFKPQGAYTTKVPVNDAVYV